MTRWLQLFIGIILLSGATGCTNHARAYVTPGVDLSGLRSFYVVESTDDSVCTNIMDALQQRGLTVASGPKLKPPYNYDAVVTYADQWKWALSMYMLELTIVVRAPDGNQLLASGHSYHTSLSRMSQQEMADEVITNIFNAKP